MSNDRSNSHVIKYTIFIPFLIFYSSRGRKMFRFIHLIRFSTSFKTYYTWYNNVTLWNRTFHYFSHESCIFCSRYTLYTLQTFVSDTLFKYISNGTRKIRSKRFPLNFPTWIIATILSLIEDTFYTIDTDPRQRLDSAVLRKSRWPDVSNPLEEI